MQLIVLFNISVDTCYISYSTKTKRINYKINMFIWSNSKHGGLAQGILHIIVIYKNTNWANDTHIGAKNILTLVRISNPQLTNTHG